MAAEKKNRLFPDAWEHKDHLEDSSDRAHAVGSPLNFSLQEMCAGLERDSINSSIYLTIFPTSSNAKLLSVC